MKAEIIIEKLKNGIKLTKEEIEFMVFNYTNDLINDEIMGEFLLLIKEKGLSYEETYLLTEAMINTGDILDLKGINRVVIDKHSTGGVGDKVTFLVAPIISALGFGVAKMSGRSLGFTGGTIDKLESINGYKVNISNEEFINNVNNIGICIISQTGSLAPADKKIYALRDEIGAVESIPLIASSIMSKKIASGAKYIVIDLKVGKGAFMKDEKNATILANYMIKIGEYFNRKVICVLTNMDTPLGYTVGNSIEVKEVIDFWNKKREPRLEKLVIELATEMLLAVKKINKEEAYNEVIKVLNNGEAKNKFYEWIKNQNGEITSLKLGEKKLTINSKKSGYITEIDPIKLSKLLFDLGAGRLKKEDDIDLTVGTELINTIYSKVEEGTPLINIYYNKEIENLESRVQEIFKIESIIENEKDIIINVIK